MTTHLTLVSYRGIRSLHYTQFLPPWPFVKRGRHGQRKIGPYNVEKHKYPGQNREFELLNPKWKKENDPRLHRYTGVQDDGFVDEKTGEYIQVREMRMEIVVPDLANFKLKPYVSYRTDPMIESRRTKYEEKVKEKGSEALADLYTPEDQRWPPPKMTPTTLFEVCYGEKIREAFKAGHYDMTPTKGEEAQSEQAKKKILDS